MDYIKGFMTHVIIQPDDVYTQHCPINEVPQMHTIHLSVEAITIIVFDLIAVANLEQQNLQ